MKKFLIILIILVFLFIMAFSLVLFKAAKSTGRDPVLDARADIIKLETGILMYKLDNGIIPTTEQGLKALIKKPLSDPVPSKWRPTGYLESKEILIDPWGKNYIYNSLGEKSEFEIMTFGRDGRAGGSDINKDIHNWDLE